MLSTPIEVGKKYRRRNGLISICTKIGWNSSQHGDTVKYDCGHNTWKSNGRTSMYYESDGDIIEEVKENEIKIEVGKWYKTREGYKAFVSHKIIDGVVATCPYGGYVIDQFNTAALWCWCENGTDSRDGEMHEYDLIEEWKEPKSGVAYLNVYKDDTTDYAYMNRTIADDAARDVVRLACVRVEWKEGQFDD